MTTLRERIELPQAIESFIEVRTADALFVVSPDYRIVHWDARADLTGLLAEEMAGNPCYEVVQGECEDGNPLSEQLCSVMRLAQAGQSAPSYDVRLFTRGEAGGRSSVPGRRARTDEAALETPNLLVGYVRE